ERYFKLGKRIVETPQVKIGGGKGEMRPGVFGVGPDRLQGRALDNRHGGCRVLPTHMTAKGMAYRKHGKRLGIIRVDGDRLLEQPLSQEIVLAGHAPEVR